MKRFILFCLLSLSLLSIKAQCWKQVSAGSVYSAGIKTDGTLWMWGYMTVFGAGTIVNSRVPVQIGTASNWSFVSAGFGNVMAIQSNGTLWGMGDNSNGQLGIGVIIGSNVLLQVGTATNWSSVSVGEFHSIGLRTNGTLWGWGDNMYNQLGNGTVVSTTVPVQIGTATDWRNISTKYDYMNLATKTNGTLWVWGCHITTGSAYLGLGAGTYTATIPTQIGNDTDWQGVVAEGINSLALKTNGTLWGWGANMNGELGDGTYIAKIFPTQIGIATDWQKITDYSISLKTSGTLWAWGFNGDGQLGNGTNITSNIPVQSGTATNWQSMSQSGAHSLGIKTDGSLWGWGRNTFGEIGDGTNVSKNYPVEILSLAVTANASATNICAGSPVTLSGGGANTYTWTGGVSNGVPFVPTVSGTYTVTGSDTHGCHNTATVNITIAPPSTVTAVASSTTVCSGQTVTLSGSGGSSYVWSNGVTDGLAFAPTATSTYTMVDGAGCSNTASITVNVIASPTVVINTSSTNVCAGNSVTLSASGATTYTWTSGVSNGVPFVPPSSSVYTVSGSNASGCSDAATVAITVTPNTTVTANATSTTICTGGTVTLTGSGGSSYTWSNGVTDGASFTPGATSTYTVTGGACSNTASITVNVNPFPVVSVNSMSICAGANALLTASVNPASGTTYSWSQPFTGSSLIVSPVVNTSYTVTATNNGCSASAVASVSVIPVIVPVTGFSYPSPLCLTASNPLPAGVIGFSTGGVYSSGTGITTDPATGQVDLSNSMAGTYVVTYSVAANGCNPQGIGTATIILNDPVAAVTGFSYPTPLCSNDADPSPLLNPNFTTGGNFSGSAVNVTSGSLDLSALTAGTYTVSYMVNAANCILAGTGTTTLIVQANPVLSIGTATTIIVGEQATLTASSSANTYTWFPAISLTCSDCASPIASPGETTTYCVRTSDGVCTNSACVTIIVESLCDGDKGFFLPNAFSPNNDGNNDVFCVQGRNRCVTNFQMIVYDRWGEKVFESSDLSFCWDGTYKGKVLSPDVFVYYIKARDQNQKELIKKGNISLIK